MNLKKIAFIICVNSEVYFEECCWYINRLYIPESYEIDIISVREAGSMTEAYNAAMESSDAKYKVYLHQDVFIYNRNFIADIVKLFWEDENIGIMGVVGGINISRSGIMYSSLNCGNIILSDWNRTECHTGYQKEPYLYVEALDGLLLATQYDIRWREDILKQWDFYDVAQCLEFRKADYQIAIPFQNIPWVNHDCGYNKLKDYNKNRKIVVEAYTEFFTDGFREEDFPYSCEIEEDTERLYREIKGRIDAGCYSEAEMLLAGFEDNGKNKELLLMKHILEISQIEKETSITPQVLRRGLTADELLERYTRIKFYLRRLEMGERTESQEILQWIQINTISYVEIIMIIKFSIIDKKYVLEQIAKAYRTGKDDKKAAIVESCM